MAEWSLQFINKEHDTVANLIFDFCSVKVYNNKKRLWNKTFKILKGFYVLVTWNRIWKFAKNLVQLWEI